MVEEELSISISKKDVDEMQESFREFGSNIKQQVQELKEVNAELFLIRDEREGITIESQSKKFSAKELKQLVLTAYQDILNKRSGSISKPDYV